MNRSSVEPIETVLYTARTHVTGGRHDGHGRSSDGELQVALSTPGSGKAGTNPEQLFAIGYSACFLGAIGAAAAKRKMRVPEGTAVDAEVDLGKIADGNYQIAVRLNVSLPGVEPGLQQELLAEAHRTCPYSRATRGDVDVQVAII